MAEQQIPSDAPAWQQAWAWVVRQHERSSFGPADQAALAAWLEAAPAHREAYAQASRLWLAAGLLPPANDIVIPGSGSEHAS